MLQKRYQARNSNDFTIATTHNNTVCTRSSVPVRKSRGNHPIKFREISRKTFCYYTAVFHEKGRENSKSHKFPADLRPNPSHLNNAKQISLDIY